MKRDENDNTKENKNEKRIKYKHKSIKHYIGKWKAKIQNIKLHEDFIVQNKNNTL